MGKSSYTVLPPGTRLHKDGMYVIEQAPVLRTVSISTNWHGVKPVNGVKGKHEFRTRNYSPSRSETNKVGGVRRYRLAMPYCVYFCDPSGYSLRVGFATKSLETLDDVIYIPCLPNVGACLTVCMGNSPKGSSPQGIIQAFWQSIFSYFLEHCERHQPDDPRVETWEEWERNGVEDPFFVLGVNWKGGRKLSDFL